MKNLFKLSVMLFTFASTSSYAQSEEYKFPFQNPDLSISERVDDLVARLTLEEKVLQMEHDAPAIERLGIPAYNWWNEALHGVARTTEKVTVFPQAIGMAASFDNEALYRVADAASSEGRAIFNSDRNEGRKAEIYRGLTYWTPNVNIFRDPRWGRGQETYGEDPYLTGAMGVAMVNGLEGDNPEFLKAVACAKHYAVHSGPEHNRHSFDAHASKYDLWDTYLPAFKKLVIDGKVHGVMCAYNRLDGQPCCGNDKLMVDILREQWGFKGYVTSDCWGVNDFVQFHKTHPDAPSSTSDAVLHGTDLECGNSYRSLVKAVGNNQILERQINKSVKRLFEIRMRLGMFNPNDKSPYASIGREVLECDAHKKEAYEMAQKSMVLLKNSKNTLPINSSKIKTIAIVGPNADSEAALLSNYFGRPTDIITPLEAFKKRFEGKAKIIYVPGVGHVAPLEGGESFAKVASQVKSADVIIFIGGITADYEGEAGDAGAAGYGGFASGDRTTIILPPVQTDLMKELKKTGKPLVFVNMSGSTMSLNWESENADAIIQAWYGGQAGGDAIADVITGEYNPAGRMPLTSYKSDSDLPDFEDYSMDNRTYRYFKGEVSYPFGYGLSFTTFEYNSISVAEKAETGKNVVVTATVTNTGDRDGDEVLQLYVSHKDRDFKTPICALKGFHRIHLKKGESATFEFELDPQDLALVDAKGNLVESEGTVEIYVGGGQPKYAAGVGTELKLKGAPYQIM